MGISTPKERATFSLDRAVKARLERTVPKSKRSNFVESAIAEALSQISKQDALDAIRRFKPYPVKGSGAVETLRQLRKERGESLAPSDPHAQK